MRGRDHDAEDADDADDADHDADDADHDAAFIPDLSFSAEVVEWRGPAPFYFVVAPPEEGGWLTGIMREVTYGWGMIPVAGRVGRTDFTTSLWPRKGTWWVPLKDAVRRAEGIELGDVIEVELSVRPASGPRR